MSKEQVEKFITEIGDMRFRMQIEDAAIRKTGLNSDPLFIEAANYLGKAGNCLVRLSNKLDSK